MQYFCKAISAVPSSVKTEVFNLHEYANFPTKWTANKKVSNAGIEWKFLVCEIIKWVSPDIKFVA